MSKGKASGPGFEHVSKSFADINLGGSGASEDGDWEQVTRKNKKGGGSTAKKLPANAPSMAFEQQGVVHRQDMRGNGGFARGTTSARNNRFPDNRRETGRVDKVPAPTAVSQNRNTIAEFIPAQRTDFNWSNRTSSTNTEAANDVEKVLVSGVAEAVVDDDDDDEEVYSDDHDDDILSDDSDESPQSYATHKDHKMLKAFYEALDKLPVEEINDPARQWHCPACQGGPGAIDWYRGLQPLITHAKTKGSVRVKLHRDFADLLEEELNVRGACVVPCGDTFGKWEGLQQETKDFEIVWPPMVIIMNTRLEKDEKDKWNGMGNRELLDYFSLYRAVKARHSYGPQGHRGMSVLIFESSAVGYMEAERLDKHFIEQRIGREAWENPHRVLFRTPGKRLLYGFLAVKEDMDRFNQHCQGKTRLKFDMRSYKEMVVSQMKQMSEDNQKLHFYKEKVAREQSEKKAYKETAGILSEKLRMVSAQNRIVRQRTKQQWEQNKEEMKFQEEFFKEQKNKIHDDADAKEEDFEKFQQEEREKVKLSSSTGSTVEDLKCRAENLQNFIKIQEEEMEAYNAEREKLMELRNAKMTEIKKRFWEEEVEIERGYYAAITELMEKYKPGHKEDA
ncbi:suppressor of gene silencing 3-like protein [Drosera capensis]